MNDADYFIKADDDSYVIVENLRMLLQPYSPNDPIYFGCRFILPVDHRLGQVNFIMHTFTSLCGVRNQFSIGLYVWWIWLRTH